MPEKKPYLLDRKKGLYLKHTKTKGRGVFCTTTIRAGEELESTPALILNQNEHKHINKTVLRDYVFGLGKLPKKIQAKAGITDIENSSCVIMGMMSFCNDDAEPNAQVMWEEREGTLYHVLRALRNIPKGTEICTTYGPGWFDDHPMG